MKILVCRRCLTDKWQHFERDDGSKVKVCGAWWGSCGLNGIWMDHKEWVDKYHNLYDGEAGP
nr:hypothetical protein [uncultured Mediterranean phage uvMED]